MMAFNPQMQVRIEPFEGPRAPCPHPLESGFTHGRTYRVLGIHSPSETSEAYLILSNDRDELWFISNRHCRFAGLASATDDAIARPIRQALPFPQIDPVAMRHG
jgi:hypothetical protein